MTTSAAEVEGGMETAILSRFEVTRLVGLRSLSLSEGAAPAVLVRDTRLKEDCLYVAALELRSRCLEACIVRGGRRLDVKTVRLPQCLDTLLDTMDGGKRSYGLA